MLTAYRRRPLIFHGRGFQLAESRPPSDSHANPPMEMAHHWIAENFLIVWESFSL
uniref:Uncharacterized protein n=1 Tax=Rhizophora mucronata TaxID=61149 RepID=A0A2P2P0L1_RHIMU